MYPFYFVWCKYFVFWVTHLAKKKQSLSRLSSLADWYGTATAASDVKSRALIIRYRPYSKEVFLIWGSSNKTPRRTINCYRCSKGFPVSIFRVVRLPWRWRQSLCVKHFHSHIDHVRRYSYNRSITRDPRRLNEALNMLSHGLVITVYWLCRTVLLSHFQRLEFLDSNGQDSSFVLLRVVSNSE